MLEPPGLDLQLQRGDRTRCGGGSGDEGGGGWYGEGGLGEQTDRKRLFPISASRVHALAVDGNSFLQLSPTSDTRPATFDPSL